MKYLRRYNPYRNVFFVAHKNNTFFNHLNHLVKKAVCIMGLALGICTGSQAALISFNDSAFAPAQDGLNVTRDTDSGLDWLDLTVTDAVSFNTVDATNVTPAWRRATLDEVIGLYQNAGLVHPVTNQVLTDFSVNLGSPLSLTNAGVTEDQFRTIFFAVQDLLMQIGITGGNNFRSFVSAGTTTAPDPVTPAFKAIGFLDIFYSPFTTPPSGGCLGVIDPGCFPLAVNISAPLAGSGIGDNDGRGDTGHFMVRNSVNIPSPGAPILMLTGLIVMGLIRHGDSRHR